MSVQGALRDSPADGMSTANGDLRKSRACLRGQNRVEICGVVPLSSVQRLSLTRSRYPCPVAVPGRVKLGDLRVGEDEIRSSELSGSVAARRPGEIDRPCFGSRWLRRNGGARPGKYSAIKSKIADKLSGGPLQLGKS